MTDIPQKPFRTVGTRWIVWALVALAVLLVLYWSLEKPPPRPRTLHEAVNRGTVKQIEQFLTSGHAVNDLGTHKATPLFLVSGGSRMDVARLLIAHGADVNKPDGVYGMTPLHAAVAKRSTDMIRLLVGHGANVNAVDRQGRTPIQDAILSEDRQVIALLLENGADVIERKSPSGVTVLYDVCASRRPTLAEFVLDKGVRNADRDRILAGVLFIALEKGDKDVAEFAITHGADINARDAQGRTPLQIAVQKDNAPIEQLLRRQGIMGPTSTRTTDRKALPSD